MSADPLPRKALGRTGLSVTTVGIGTAWIGLTSPMEGTTERHLDEDLGIATIHAALEAGVRFIDTAALYVNSRAERIVARALALRPDLAADTIVETKCCRLPGGSDYSDEGTLRSVAGSLERLGVSRIELIYIHDPPKEALSAVLGQHGALAALRRLQSEGVLGHIGIASNDPIDNTPYIESGEFAVAVVPDAYSLLSQIALERMFPAAERFGMGIVVATPLERGMLATGVRGSTGEHYARRFAPEVLARVGQIEDVCRAHGGTILEAALQYVARHPVVAASIPGARSPAEARANADAVRRPAPDALWTDLAPLIQTWDIVAR